MLLPGVFEALPDGMYIEADEELVERNRGLDRLCSTAQPIRDS